MSAPASLAQRLLNVLRHVWYRTGDTLIACWQSLGRWIEARIGGSRSDPDGELAHKFRPDAAAIEEAPVPVSAHAALYVVLGLLVVALLWSIFGTLDRIVVAQGKVASQTSMIVMQSFTTSRITQIHVKPGDHVRKGDLLVTFDPAFAQADVVSLENKVRGLTVTVERIEAQLDGAPFTVSPGDAAERQTQGQIYSQEMSEFAAENSVRDSRVGALDSQVAASNSAAVGLRQQLDMARKIVGIRKSLLEEKAGTPLEEMQAESTAIDIDSRLKNTLGDIKKFGEQRTEVEAERRTFLDKWHSDHNQQLVKARQDLSDAAESLNKAHKMKDLTEMQTPADAVVLEIADRSVGSVLREGDTLLTLVPDGAHLYIEANVLARDVSYLKVGNAVRVKLEAYPFQKYGTLDGRLDVLGADSVPLKEGEQSQLVYRAQITLTETPQEMARRGFRILPGLVASADIVTGSRSIASYVLDPILRTTDESMKEP